MRPQHLLISILMVGTLWGSTAGQPKKQKIKTDPSAMQNILANPSTPSDPNISDVVAITPEMPLGPQDVLKSYEVAMGLVVDKTASEFSVIVQAQQADQITREQAEYLLQQTYQTAMMHCQVLSALHEVMQHDIAKASEQARAALKTTKSDTVLVVPFPGSVAAGR